MVKCFSQKAFAVIVKKKSSCLLYESIAPRLYSPSLDEAKESKPVFLRSIRCLTPESPRIKSPFPPRVKKLHLFREAVRLLLAIRDNAR